MFKLRRLRADTHFAIVNYIGPLQIEGGHIIEYQGIFYECKYVIVHAVDHVPYDSKAPAKTEEQMISELPELIVESFPLI
jgi:hypothetical protein